MLPPSSLPLIKLPTRQVIRRQLNYRSWPGLPPQEKGIDVAIAVDLMHLAFRRQYDALVLFSSDTDLLPALETIANLRLGHVEVACWPASSPCGFRAAILRGHGAIRSARQTGIPSSMAAAVLAPPSVPTAP